MRYGLRLGCRFGTAHDFEILHENKHRKIERCKICGLRKRWNKIYKGRIDNNEYLKMHVRNFAQRNGATKRVFNKIYQPNNLIIHI